LILGGLVLGALLNGPERLGVADMLRHLVSPDGGQLHEFCFYPLKPGSGQNQLFFSQRASAPLETPRNKDSTVPDSASAGASRGNNSRYCSGAAAQCQGKGRLLVRHDNARPMAE